MPAIVKVDMFSCDVCKKPHTTEDQAIQCAQSDTKQHLFKEAQGTFNQARSVFAKICPHTDHLVYESRSSGPVADDGNHSCVTYVTQIKFCRTCGTSWNL